MFLPRKKRRCRTRKGLSVRGGARILLATERVTKAIREKGAQQGWMLCPSDKARRFVWGEGRVYIISRVTAKGGGPGREKVL